MDKVSILKNEFINVFAQENQIYLEVYKKGFYISAFQEFLLTHPEIFIFNYKSLLIALNTLTTTPTLIGKFKERIFISIIEDGLTATLCFNLSEKELLPEYRENLTHEIDKKLKDLGIINGINKDFLQKEIKNGVQYIIAHGTPSINGTDSIIKMVQLHNAKPEVSEDEKADFYDLKLINKVNAGDWLGERFNATNGIPGKSVTGTPLKYENGKTLILNYDKNTIREVQEADKTVLYAKINGAVNNIDGKITIIRHLEINSDVDFKTGNIRFDGSVTIKGTVADSFSVEATGDIEINGDMGLGNIKEIKSTKGSIFIKGGIASKGKVVVRAAKNVFLKFVDNATVICDGSAHFGFYCINSIVEAKEVIIDSSNGHIIGGYVKAEIRVIAPIIGTEREKKTEIEVIGFDRAALKEELDNTFRKLSELKNEQQRLKQLLSALPKDESMLVANKEYNESNQKLSQIKDEIKELEEKRNNAANYLKTRGEGEITASKQIFPNCILIIKKFRIEITMAYSSKSYFIQDNEIKTT